MLKILNERHNLKPIGVPYADNCLEVDMFGVKFQAFALDVLAELKTLSATEHRFKLAHPSSGMPSENRKAERLTTVERETLLKRHSFIEPGLINGSLTDELSHEERAGWSALQEALKLQYGITAVRSVVKLVGSSSPKIRELIDPTEGHKKVADLMKTINEGRDGSRDM